MLNTELAALLQAAPEAHSRRCALALNAVESSRWPAASCGLRTAATLAEEWAQQARAMASWCDVQAGQRRAAAPDSPETQLAAMLPAGQPTVESLEAGLMALAHGLGREHALRARRAMNGTLIACTAGISSHKDDVAPAGGAA